MCSWGKGGQYGVGVVARVEASLAGQLLACLAEVLYFLPVQVAHTRQPGKELLLQRYQPLVLQLIRRSQLRYFHPLVKFT